MAQRLALITAGLATLLMRTAPVFADGVHEGGGIAAHHMSGDLGWGMMMGPFMMAAIMVIVLAAIMYFLRGPTKNAPAGDDQTAIGILNERYARGDIDHDEFEERKRRLTA